MAFFEARRSPKASVSWGLYGPVSSGVGYATFPIITSMPHFDRPSVAAEEAWETCQKMSKGLPL